MHEPVSRSGPGPPGAPATFDAEIHFQALVEQLPAVIDINAIDANATPLFVNSNVRQMLGYTADEWLADPTLWLASVHPDDRERIVAEHLRTNRSGERFSAEYRMIARDGRVVWIADEATLIRDEAGRPRYWQGVKFDITARKATEDALRASERRLRSLLRHSRDVVSVVDANGVIQAVIPDDGVAVGYPSSAIIGGALLDFVHPDDREAVARTLRDCLARPGVGIAVEARLRSATGGWRRLDMVGTNLLDEPAVGGIVVNARDVTERALVEEQLLRSEERFRSLILRSTDIITVLDADGVVTWVSPALEATLGHPPEATIGLTAFTRGHPEDRETGRRFLAEVLASPGVSLKTRVRFAHRDGGWRWLDVSATNLLDDPAVGGVVVNSRDVTAIVEDEAALREAESKYRLLVERVPAVTYVQASDDLATALYMSPQILALTGYAPDEWLSSPDLWRELIHPDDFERVNREHLRTNATGEPFSMEYRIVARDGRVVWIRDEGVLLRTPSGEPLYWQGVFLDITERKLVEEQYHAAEARYRTLVEQIPAVTYSAELGTLASSYISPQIEALTGYTPDEWVAGGDLWARRLHPDDRERVVAAFERAESSGEPLRIEYRMFARDGGLIWVRDEGAPAHGADGRALNWQGVMSDITDRKRAEDGLRQSEERFRALVQHASDVITVFNAEGRITYESPAVRSVLGLDPSETVGAHVLDPVHPEDLARARAYLSEVVRTAGAHPSIDWRFKHTDGEWRYLESRANNLLNEPAVGGVVLHSRDVTERRMFEEQLERQAFHDGLTGLPNRALLIDRIAHGLARAQRGGGRLAVLFLDLDRFKVINDSLGHAVGDELLILVSQRLQTCVRAGDTVARLGGDEFIILLEDVVSDDEVTTVADRVIASLRDPAPIGGQDMYIAASIGIAWSGPDLTDPGDLLRNADVALYRAKAEGRARHVVFDASMNVFSVERLALEADLQRAIERGELRLRFQPEIDLRTGRVAGLEALARWEHPRRGLIPPAEFIPLAEETGLISQIGAWVLEAACQEARRWQRDGRSDAPLVISVNLSARQFQEAGLVEQIARILAETGIRPDTLRLEITESVVVQEAGSARETLQALKALGVRIAIDDFGIGYSSLAYLTRLYADTLKIDRSFVASVGNDERALPIVGAIASLAHALGMDVTAEGIEDADQLAHVREAGCDRAQGYYFSHPVPADLVDDLLTRAFELNGRAPSSPTRTQWEL